MVLVYWCVCVSLCVCVCVTVCVCVCHCVCVLQDFCNLQYVQANFEKMAGQKITSIQQPYFHLRRVSIISLLQKCYISTQGSAQNLLRGGKKGLLFLHAYTKEVVTIAGRQTSVGRTLCD